MALVLYSTKLLPIVNAYLPEMLMRAELAEAIVAVTDDPAEQLTLMRIARFESNYRVDVAACQLKGPQGEVTAWQIVARNPAERRALCVSLEDDARIALARVRESTKACHRFPEDVRLALYARGNCSSTEGQRLARHRYPGTAAIRAFVAITEEEERTE